MFDSLFDYFFIPEKNIVYKLKREEKKKHKK